MSELEYTRHEKRNPKHADLIAFWSPGLQIYAVSKLMNYSFAYYCDYYEISRETYNRFEEPDFDPPLGRLLFSEAPAGRRETAENAALRKKFYGKA